jgi:hypothetical protein
LKRRGQNYLKQSPEWMKARCSKRFLKESSSLMELTRICPSSALSATAERSEGTADNADIAMEQER